MHNLVVFWFDFLKHWGYLGIILLMAMESSIVPVPSEVVIPPAAFWAAQGKMSLVGVIAAGTFGSWLGSAITYWIALSVGRMVVVKWGKFFLITEDKLQRAEHLVHRYEAGGILFSRLLPVIRHLISIPAGIVRMNFGIFSLMTVIGSLIWCTVLAYFGQQLAQAHPDMISDPAALVTAIKAESKWLVVGVLGLCGLYFLGMRLSAKKTAE